MSANTSEANNPLADRIVVATNFLYQHYRFLMPGEQRDSADTDGIRGDLALDGISRAASMGIRYVAADGGSSQDFLDAIDPFKGAGLTVVNSTIRGRAPQRRRAFEAALALPNKQATIIFRQKKVRL